MPAGTYHFVLDCIVIASVDVTFELSVRHGSDSLVLSTWSKHFDPLSTGYDAQPYEVDKQAVALDVVEGDQLVFRYTAKNTTKAEAWIPNGDGKLAHGRIPYITLP
ncbi:MAG TPA: hypothetical protein VIV40_32160 [Kofleriaceae bacterium]